MNRTAQRSGRAGPISIFIFLCLVSLISGYCVGSCAAPGERVIGPRGAPATPGLEQAIQRIVPQPTVETRAPRLPNRDQAVEENRARAIHSEISVTPDGRTLTEEEYEQFKDLLRIGRAAPLQVAAVAGASTGIRLLAVFIAMLAGLWCLRRSWDRWFDRHVYNNTPAATVIICVLLGGLFYLLGKAIS